MNPTEKQIELHRHKYLTLATLDYLLEHRTGSIVYDGWDPAKAYFEGQKLQVEKYFAGRRLDKLQQQLHRLMEDLRNRVDLQFSGYIKEKTGYDLDLFAEVRSRVEGLLARQKIETENESYDINLMRRVYEQMGGDTQKANLLKNMLLEFYHGTAPASVKNKNGYSEVIKRVEKDGIEEVSIRISTGPKPAHHRETEIIAPDGKRKLKVAELSDGKHSSTYVNILFTTEAGAIYGTNGIHPDIRVYWKDNNTIVIETKKEYQDKIRYKQVRSFDDVIAIEYIED